RAARVAARAFAGAVFVLAVVTLLLHLVDGSALPFLGLSSVQSGSSFLLLSAAVMVFDFRGPRDGGPAAGLALGAGAIAIVALLGLLFKAELLYGTSQRLPDIGMSLPTVAAVTLL